MAAVTDRLAGSGWNTRQLLTEVAVGAGWFVVSSCFMLWTVRRASHRTELA